MEIFWRIVLAYLINEFIIRSDFPKYWKNPGFKKTAFHSGVFFIIALILTFPFIEETWVCVYGLHFSGWASLVMISFLLGVQNTWRIYTLKNFGFLDNTLYFLWDRFVHIVIIFAFCPLTGFEKNALPFGEKIVVLLCFFIVVSYGLSVLLYFIERDLYGADFPGFDEKYLMILQRTALWLLFLIPGLYRLAFIVLWIGYSIYLKHRRIMDFSNFALYAGFALTVILALVTRYIYYS
jgi:hypothetical protein